MLKDKAYWFPAKRHGWGWGMPNTWQGWAVTAVFALLLFGGNPFVLAYFGNAAFTAYTVACCAVFVVIYWLKGEPPSWRRGGSNGDA